MSDQEYAPLPREDYLAETSERHITKILSSPCPLCGAPMQVSRSFRPGRTTMVITNPCLCPVAFKGEVIPATLLMQAWTLSFTEWDPSTDHYGEGIVLPEEMREEPEE